MTPDKIKWSLTRYWCSSISARFWIMFVCLQRKTKQTNELLELWALLLSSDIKFPSQPCEGYDGEKTNIGQKQHRWVRHVISTLNKLIKVTNLQGKASWCVQGWSAPATGSHYPKMKNCPRRDALKVWWNRGCRRSFQSTNWDSYTDILILLITLQVIKILTATSRRFFRNDLHINYMWIKVKVIYGRDQLRNSKLSVLIIPQIALEKAFHRSW